jgi:predicted Fe-S protein YdhL (DUF1289 family)
VPAQLLTRIPTPCIGVCSTGIGDVVCRGCKRYAHEVIHWNSYTDAQKRSISARLEQFLTQIVAAKLTVFDAHLLASQLQAQQVRYSAQKSPLVWVFELLRAGAKQIGDSKKFGFVVDENYRDLDMPALREQIDREFFILSEAHYERYIAQCYAQQSNSPIADQREPNAGSNLPSSEFDVV